jgi:hypothetical protein
MNSSVIILAILGSILVAGAATSTIIVPVLANDLTPEDLLSVQDPLQEKVTICHIPNGDPSKAHDITVGASAVPAHLAHGDTVGPCVTEPPPPPPPPNTAKLTLLKVVNGPHPPEAFTICVTTSNDPNTSVGGTPATPPCAPGSASGFTYTVIPGYLFINEIPPPTYRMMHQCQSPINAGEDRRCTVVNDFTG